MMAGSGREIPKGKLSLIVTAHHPVKKTNPTTFLDFHQETIKGTERASLIYTLFHR